MMGYCEGCGVLVTIRKYTQKWGSKEWDYRPAVHDGCDGHTKTIRNHSSPMPDLNALKEQREKAIGN